MRTITSRALLILCGVLITACLPDINAPHGGAAAGPGNGPGTQTGGNMLGSGTFQTMAAGMMAGYQISGTAQVTLSGDVTHIELAVQGLKPDQTAYPAHVHDGSCASGGGSHYKLDATGPDAEANGVWPVVHASGSSGSGSLDISHVLRGDAKSIVIHDPSTKAKIACADLGLQVNAGQLAMLPEGMSLGMHVSGWGALTRVGGMTQTWLVVYSGLDPNKQYPAHLHNQACADGEGGKHYEIDPNAMAGQSNEIWPMLMTDGNGAAAAYVTAPGMARDDAKAIVIHDPVSKNKIACADLQ